MSSHQNSGERLYWTTKLAFGAGDIGPALTANILVFFLLPFLTNVAGLSPSLAGSVLFVGKISDAINDPIIGILSDRTLTKWGRRIPWIVFSIVPFGLVFFLQWIVPKFSDNPQLNGFFLFLYYVFIGVLFNIFYTTVNLPYQALTPELTRDYNERTSLNSYRFGFSIGASIFSLILAQIVFQSFPEDDQQKYSILGLVSSVFASVPLLWCPLIIKERGFRAFFDTKIRKIIGYLLLAISAILFLLSTPIWWRGKDIKLFFVFCYLSLGIILAIMGWSAIYAKTESHLSQNQSSEGEGERIASSSLGFIRQIKVALSNRAFLCVVGIYLSSWLAVQLTASILLFFVVYWMKLPESVFPTVAMAVQGTALIMLFVWGRISKILDKKTVYYLGSFIWILAQMGLFLIQPGQKVLMYLLAIMAGCGVAVAYLIPWSMIPDVIDLDELETGKRREGIFYGFMVLLQKFGLALGLFLVGVALEMAGFIKATPGEPRPLQPASALWAIRFTVALLPAIILTIGIILAYFYPITREVHASILSQLDQKKVTKEN
ncbi:MAG: MFS transporter [Geminocystis sp.]|nr:MFS transporter [Geminocystis sp.]MDW8462338.1 MFS transporter [Geminocystis sp.]